jgi:rubrerythrin
MTQKQEMEALVELLKQWQKLEENGIQFLNELKAETPNPILKEVVDIIQHDSAQHRRVQQLMIDGLTKEAFSLSPEEVAEVWGKLEEHDKLEEQAIAMAQEARRTAGHPVIRYFLNYLLADEEKHHRMLENLEDIKRDLYPYGW